MPPMSAVVGMNLSQDAPDMNACTSTNKENATQSSLPSLVDQATASCSSLEQEDSSFYSVVLFSDSLAWDRDDDLSSFYSATPFEQFDTNEENGQNVSKMHSEEEVSDTGSEPQKDACRAPLSKELSCETAKVGSNKNDNNNNTEYEIAFVSIDENEETEQSQLLQDPTRVASDDGEAACSSGVPGVPTDRPRLPAHSLDSPLPNHEDQVQDKQPPTPNEQELLLPAPSNQQGWNEVLPTLPASQFFEDDDDDESRQPSVHLESHTLSSNHRSIFGDYWERQPSSSRIYVDVEPEAPKELLGMTLRLEMESPTPPQASPRVPRRSIFGSNCFSQPKAPSQNEPRLSPPLGSNKADSLPSRRSSSSLRQCRYSGEFRRPPSDADLDRSVSFSEVDKVKVFEKPVEQYADEKWEQMFC